MPNGNACQEKITSASWIFGTCSPHSTFINKSLLDFCGFHSCPSGECSAVHDVGCNKRKNQSIILLKLIVPVIDFDWLKHVPCCCKSQANFTPWRVAFYIPMQGIKNENVDTSYGQHPIYHCVCVCFYNYVRRIGLSVNAYSTHY